MQLSLDRSTLEKLLHHAAFAAHLVGHLDDDAHAELIRQLGDHVDTIAHELTELLGDPSALAAPDAAAPDDRLARGCSRPSREVHREAPPVARCPGGALQRHRRLFCVLRDNLGKADAFMTSAEYQMEQAPSGDEDEDLRRQSHVEHLVEAGKLAVRAAAYTSGEIEDRVRRRRGA
jgi:hypothetical protein